MRSPILGQIDGLPEKFGKQFALELFRKGNFCRHFEYGVKKAAEQKKISIPFYLSVCSEFNSAALSMVLPKIPIFAQHRCHSLYLNFGGKPELLRDELLGLPSGLCGGRAGSNAFHCPSINMFGHSGLMGEQVPIAVGAAFASNKPVLTICGDASVEEDYIYPALGWAATRNLPVLFVCEDNNLSILTKVAVRRNWSSVAVAQSLGMFGVDITDDPWLIAYYAKQILDSEKPGFMNIHTVRLFWHAGTGMDGEPEWDRYAIIVDKLKMLGISENELDAIDCINKETAENIWQAQQY